MRGIIIDRTTKTVELVDKDWTLKDMQKIIGGYIESVAPPVAGTIMYVNEDGKRLKLLQWKMPFMLQGKAGMLSYCGNAVIRGEPDDEGKTTGLEKEQAENLLAFLKAEIVWE
ncbi:hypothetical protein MASR2M29_02450 [Spirochaetota bacterium]